MKPREGNGGVRFEDGNVGSWKRALQKASVFAENGLFNKNDLVGFSQPREEIVVGADRQSPNEDEKKRQ